MKKFLLFACVLLSVSCLAAMLPVQLYVQMAKNRIVSIVNAVGPFLATCALLYLAYVGYRKARIALKKV